jgi:hypothetical protein
MRWFNDNEIPPYAILSHTWGEEEVTFDHVRQGTAHQLKGYPKVLATCNSAAQNGFEYVWIDTCCINKESSAELSEAINSMFQWYERADYCCAYLQDVMCNSPGQEGGKMNHELVDSLSHSRWFTRGWTLQELLAPKEIYFFNEAWEPIGTRTSLSSILSLITSIDQSVLLHQRIPPDDSGLSSLQILLASKSVAKRMSWAARRETTRQEDLAYCMLGLFDVNMPLLYGEGLRKAFYRLQIEILRESTDQSLLAWHVTSLVPVPGSPGGALASHPLNFAKAGNIETFVEGECPIDITSRGLRMRMQVGKKTEQYFGILACHEEDDFTRFIAIPLARNQSVVSWPHGNGSVNTPIFFRDLHSPIMKVGMDVASSESLFQTVLFSAKGALFIEPSPPAHFVLEFSNTMDHISITAEPSERWNYKTRTMQFRDVKETDRQGALAITVKRGRTYASFGIAFGVNANKKPPSPYLNLHHGPSSTKTIESWLKKLAAHGTKKDQQATIFVSGMGIRAGINQASIFGKPVYTIEVRELSM